MKTCNLVKFLIFCLFISNLAQAEDATRDGTSFTLGNSHRLQVKGDAMNNNISTCRLILKKEHEEDFELARWTKDYNVYNKIGLEIPAKGVYSGISIVSAKMSNGIVAVFVKYETDFYIVAALVDEKKTSNPKFIKNIKVGKAEEMIMEIRKKDNEIEVTLTGGRKEMVSFRE